MGRRTNGFAWFGCLTAMVLACGGGGGGPAMDLAGPDAGDPGIITDVPAGDPGVPTDLPERDLGGDEATTGADEGQDPDQPVDLPGDSGTDAIPMDLGADLPPEIATDTGCQEECVVQNAFGTCRGQQTCGEPETCTAAVPAEEQCNGLDDNCDGSTDEGDLCADDGIDCTRAVCAGESGCRQVVESGWCLIQAECHRAGSENPANPCEVCVPDGEGGSFQPRDGVCDDGNPCTMGDRCQQGACVSGQNVCLCAQDDDCAAYEDGNLCNGTLRCDTSRVPQVCVVDPATVVSCDPSNDRPCLANRCDPATGTCAMTPVDDGATCDDGDLCTLGDHCQQGTCQGTSYSCDDDLDCTADSCNGSGGCTHSLLPYFCRVPNDQGGTVCVPEGQSPDGDPCRTCDPRQNPDDWTFLQAPCDDGDACTAGDLCVEGDCLGVVYQCDDGLDCTMDSCDGMGGCEAALIPGFCLIDGACVPDGSRAPQNPCLSCDVGADPRRWTPNHLSCEDGNPCTTGEVCLGGTCQATASRNCNDENLCTDDWCDPGVPGGCVNQPNIHPCDDGNPCTVGDLCDQGSCTPGPIQACECQEDGDCPDDGDLCNGRPFCSRAVYPFRCVIDPSTVVDCDHGRDTPCLQNQCVPATGLCELTAIREGETCDDGNACSAGDRCVTGTCTGTDYSCDDLQDCTIDVCQGDGTCQHTLQAGYCLIAGTCVEAGARDPDNPCLRCDPVARPYAWTPLNNGTPCDDQQDCTFGDACQGGQCRGRPYGCDDGLSCTTDSCQGDGTCRHDLLSGYCLIDQRCRTDGESLDACLFCDATQDPTHWSVRTGAACDDGDLCTANDRCQALTGRCAGTPYDCDDGLWCTRDSCQGDGTCSHVTDPLACLIDGACQGRGERSPLSECLVCWPERSQTDWTAIPDGVACSDQNECTVNDRCQAGRCVAGPPRNCDDRNPCTDDACDPVAGCLHPPSDRLAIDFETPGRFEFENSDPNTGWYEANSPHGWPSRALAYGNPITGTYETGGQRNVGTARSRDLLVPHPGDPLLLSFDLWLDTEWSHWWDTFGQGRSFGGDDFEVGIELLDGSQYVFWASYWNPSPIWWKTSPQNRPIGPRAVRVSGIDLEPALRGMMYPPFRLFFRFDTTDGAWNAFGGVIVDRVVIGQACDDGDACVQGESCQRGRCEGLPWDCDDGSVCTQEACDPASGCQTIGFEEAEVFCDDYDRCTEDSTCEPGTGWCAHGTSIPCPDDGNECTADRCDSVRGCIHDPVPNYQVPCYSGGICVDGRCATWTPWDQALRRAGDWFTEFWAGTWPEPGAPLSAVGGTDHYNRIRDDTIYPAILVGEVSSWAIDRNAVMGGEAAAAEDRLAVGMRFDPLASRWAPWTGTWKSGTGWSFLPEDNPPLEPPDAPNDAWLTAVAHVEERGTYLMAGPGRKQGRAPYLQECPFDEAPQAWGPCATLAAFESWEPSCALFQDMQPSALWSTGGLTLLGGSVVAEDSQRYLAILVHDGSPRTRCGSQTGFQGAFVARDDFGLGLLLPSDQGWLLDIDGNDIWDGIWAVGSKGLLLRYSGNIGRWRQVVPDGPGIVWDDTHVVGSVLVETDQVHFVGAWEDPILGLVPFYLHARLDSQGDPIFDWRQDFPEVAGLPTMFRDILRDPNNGDLVVLGSLYDPSQHIHLGVITRFGAH